MRLPLLSLAALWALGSLAQQTPMDFFVIDPYEANGYFITSPELLDKLAAGTIRVDVIVRADDGQGGTTHSVVQTINLDRLSQHGRAARDLIEALPAGTEVVYDAYALNGTNSPVGEIHAWRPGPIVSEKCNLICEQNRHGWKLTAFADAGNGNTSIDISNPGRYFFVTAHNGHWQEFKNLNPAAHYGFSSWSTYDCLPGTPGCQFNATSECFRIAAPDPPNANTATCVGLPDENGYPLPPTVASSPCWAIRKDKGNWRNLHQSAYQVFSLGNMCDAQPGTGAANLLAYYNADDLVENAIATLSPSPGPLNCANGYLSSVSDSPGGGLGVGCTWIEMLTNSAVENPDGTVDIVQEVLYVLHCEEGGPGSDWSSVAPLGDRLNRVGGIIIRRWDEGKANDVVNVPIPKTPDGKAIDPKLIQVMKQELAPGLYEVMVPLTDGRIIRHFEQIDETVIIGASFASYASVNIYPVPVKGHVFALDFNIAWPMEIGVTIMNNLGTPYHSETLDFELPGLNKHVVKMQTPWPAGIYHAVFHFSDGSSSSRTFSVAAPE